MRGFAVNAEQLPRGILLKKIFTRAAPWAFAFALSDAAFIFAMFLLSPEKAPKLTAYILLASALAFAVGCFAEHRRRKKLDRALGNFSENMDDTAALEVDRVLGGGFKNRLSSVVKKHAELRLRAKQLSDEADDSREYIEEWVHEVKTPLAAASLLTDNRADEMTEDVNNRLKAIFHAIDENTEQILYYSRLNAPHPDINFENVRLSRCLLQTVEDFEPFILSRKIAVTLPQNDAYVTADRRILLFILSLLMSNAVKYCSQTDGKIVFILHETDNEIALTAANNGDGVHAEDLPFIFDKGFTGNCPNRKKATGMGLYLARKYADAICAEITVPDVFPPDCTFAVKLTFAK